MEEGGLVAVGAVLHQGAVETVCFQLQDDLKVNQSNQTF